MTEARRPPPPFDLVVVTGFLGAGKTTLLNRLLRDPALADTLVIINEFGAIGLDHLLVEKVHGDMLVMTSGCLCCTIRGDLIQTLEDVLRRRDNDRIGHFKRVVIETTGLADPAPVLHTIMAHPYLRMRFKLQAVVTLVDALVGDATLDRHAEAVKQAVLADRLVLTKTDLLKGPADVSALRLRLRRLNPGARVFDVAKGEAEVPALFGGLSYDPTSRAGEAAAWLAAEALEEPDHHHHAHHGSHDHTDVNRHDASIRAFCLRDPRPLTPQALSLFLELLRSAHGPRLLRLKGLVALSDDPERPTVVHGVQHVMHPPYRLDRWPDDDHESRMVFILQDLDPSYVEGLWRAATGDCRVDEADLATRTDSPLAPAPGGLLG